MEFIDNTGHIFSLPSYEDNPISLQYTENDYIFWMTDSTASINNYYIKPIRFIIGYNDLDINSFNLEVSVNSGFYKLIGQKYLQEQLESNNDIYKSVSLDKENFKNILTLNDFYFDNLIERNNIIVTSANNHKYYLFSFYVVGISEIEGTFLSNITIKITSEDDNEYTPITVGCSFVDECEELIINGKNMGIRLPKEILKAIYSSSFYTKYADEKLLKNKLKELLLNYMNIKGETGNVKSLLNSLKWFGWGNHIEISQLLKTDNHIQTQFILDYFDIDNDVKDVFKYFNRTNNISLSVLYNKEIGENYEQDFNQTLIGEGKPILEDLFNKTIEVVKDNIIFYKPYYNFIFNELALKLDCLKYYYKQYFLPVHISINRASIDYKVYANSTKFSAVGYSTMTDKPVYLPEDSKNVNVVFPDTHKLVFKQNTHLIDSKYNEFSNYNNEYEGEDLYYVNENCITIPITIENTEYEYIKESFGIYLFNGSDYVKINYFYKSIGSKYELTNATNATHYRINESDFMKSLENVDRYNRYSKLYTKDNYGDYFIDENGDYVKMNFFYKMITENEAELSDRINATHFSIAKNKDIQNLADYGNNRYLKISEEYYNCKIILTASIVKQNNEGHYIYKNRKYIYKDQFYVKKPTDDISENLDKYISDSGNYIKYYDEFIEIKPNDRYNIETVYLINNNNFNYYQSTSQYYKNLVIIPRLLNNELDWKNAHYRLSVLVNNKWFSYDFDIVIPNIYLDMGKLEYKYNLTYGEDTYYPFNQLRSLTNNNVEFNAFMFEPDLITINTLFKGQDKEGNDKLLTFIDKLLETGIYDDNDGHLISISEMKMYEFYKKYYSNILKVPYNTKYYNKIHLFDIYIKNDLTVQYFITTHNNTFKYIIFRFNKSFNTFNNDNSYNIYGYFRKESDRELGNAYINTTDTYYWDNMDNTGQYYISLASSYISAYVQDNSIKCEKIYIEYENGIKIEFSPIYKNNNLYVNVKGEKLKYLGINKDVELYGTFFNDNCTTKLNINEFITYDTYLMHDDKEWYMVFISQYPIASYNNSSLLNIHKTSYSVNGYNVVYANYSVEKFLINRMQIIRSNGVNQFNKDDLIIVGVNNNDYQFNIDLTNKWSINKIYDVNSLYSIGSNTNLTIITNNNIDNLYTPGYYNVQLDYIINGLDDNKHKAIAQYKILDKYQDIKYPKIIEKEETKEIFSIKDTISDFTILYENTRGERYKSKKVLEPSLGWLPIGIKIMNKGYYGPQQTKSIYIGLKWLSTTDPDNGFSAIGNQTEGRPFLGFSGHDIEGLKNYWFIAYRDREHTQRIGDKTFSGTTINESNYNSQSGQTMNIYPQTDLLSAVPLNNDSTPKYPAPNDRGFHFDPSSEYGEYIINILNDDDTLNTSLLDDDCALSDWNGKHNTQIIINSFGDDSRWNDWKTISTIPNYYNEKFSPVAACAWRYHTYSTNQGDWYLPSFAEVLFLTYNLQRLSDLFTEIASKYPEYCKTDLLEILTHNPASNALWTCTEFNSKMMWEIHPGNHIHALGKTATWNSFPYIQIDD